MSQLSGKRYRCPVLIEETATVATLGEMGFTEVEKIWRELPIKIITEHTDNVDTINPPAFQTRPLLQNRTKIGHA
jgi:hypothetical protein